MVILVDTREQSNQLILDYFDKKKIAHKSKKLDYGDYSFVLPADADMGIIKPLMFDDEVVIERKGSLTELSGNLTKDRERFEKELIRKKDAKFLLMIEDGSWEKIDAGDYRSKYNPKSFKATLNKYISAYNISVNFRVKEMAGEFIFGVFYYHLREVLKNYSEVE